MPLDIQLPLANVRPVRIRELQESALCFSYDKYGLHIFFDQYEDNGKAILLNGDHAFHSFDVDRTHSWKGLAVTEYKLIVDLNSALDTENAWPPLGSISVTPDGVLLRVAVTDAHGFTDETGLKLAVECQQVAPGLHVSFGRWAFQIGNHDDPQLFWIEAKAK